MQVPYRNIEAEECFITVLLSALCFAQYRSVLKYSFPVLDIIFQMMSGSIKEYSKDNYKDELNFKKMKICAEILEKLIILPKTRWLSREGISVQIHKRLL